MDEIKKRLTDWPTTIPGAAAVIAAAGGFCKQYGVVINLTPVEYLLISVGIVGIGLIFSGGKEKSGGKE